MRVLVLTGAVGDLSPAQAGRVVASPWAAAGHAVAVVPMTADGNGLDDAVAALGPGRATVVRQTGGTTTGPLGDAAARAIAAGASTVLLDLTQPLPVDGGAGLLEALGATAAAPLDEGPVLGDLGQVRLPSLPARLVAVVAAGTETAPLLGVRGVAATVGFETGQDRAEVLALDAALARLAAAVGLPDPPAGAGAGQGAALAVLALGGAVRTAPAALAELVDLDRSLALADLLVVVTDALDFGGAGVPLAQAAAGWAATAGAPCIVVARAVQISSRELRTLGIESAYGLTGDEGDAGLAELAQRVARTWSW